jgi:hypothetical protein
MNKIKKDLVKELDKKMFQYISEEHNNNMIDKDDLDNMLLILSTKLQVELDTESIKKISKIKQIEYDKSCLNISKFYIKIFHIVYILIDILKSKDNKSKNNVCLHMLKELSSHENKVFPPMDNLYHDKYLFDNKFHHMSKSTKKRYEKDLKSFIFTFTGKKEIPSHVSSFEDITIHDYDHEANDCVENYLFYEYASHLKSTITKSIDIQKKLEEILENIIDVKEKRIHSSLTEHKLNLYIREAREYIIQLWNECSNGYTHGKRLLEKIMEELYLKKIIAEQKSIKKTLDKVYSQKVQPNNLYISEKDLRMDILEQ